MSAYPDLSVPAAYQGAAQTFTRLICDLDAPERQHDDHAAIERRIHAEGTELLRQMYQAWLTVRAAAEPRRDVVGVDDKERTHHRTAPRPLGSVFGDVTIERDRVGAIGADALVPLDALLNLTADRFSFGVRERVVQEAIRGSFDSSVAAIRATTGARVSKRQAEEMALAAAVDFDAFYEVARIAGTSAAADLMVLTADGKGIVMRADGLRNATRRAAEKGSHKLAKRLSKGEKRNRKRMAEVAAVYDLAASPRTEADILGNLDGKSAATRPRARNKRVWASLEKPASSVIRDMFEEASRRDPDHARTWVALVDGNKPQIREIRAEAKRENVKVTLVLDIIHVIEYLWTAAWDVFSEGDAAAEKWVRKYLTQILRGRASIVAAAIGRVATTKKLTKRTGIDKAAGYLLSNKELLRYDEYLRDGLPIATGVIEGACRHLVKDRMDITGARWGLTGAEAILRLRSLHVSGDLPAYWAFHRSEEFVRNHASSYADSEDEWLFREAA